MVSEKTSHSWHKRCYGFSRIKNPRSCHDWNKITLNSGQTIATSQRNISQHCRQSVCKLRPNDPNISTQQIATLSGATYCPRLATLLQRVETCCEFKIELVRMLRRNIVARTWQNDYNIVQHPQMLHEKFDHFQTKRPTTPNTSHYVATRRNGVAKRTQYVAPNNAAICCV